ncbi:uncharacterized protein LOC141588556 [Silene latifolia]|uniref:uncharacterized protein LOC141588556 n=1 Tax=Silene latifolia TaxID=37657 RepID=UPI003D7769B9
MTGLWAIWEARNKVVFDGKQWSVDAVLRRVRELVEEMREEGAGRREVEEEVVIGRGWRKPMQGWNKVNVDAGKMEGLGMGLGAVCRDEEEGVLWAATRQEMVDREPQLLEAEAVLMGLSEARRRGMLRVEVESDCLGVVQDLKNRVRGRSDLFLIYDEILVLCSSFIQVEFSFVKRNCNRVAHALAHVVSWSVGTRVWVVDFPQNIVLLAAYDRDNMN